MPAIIRTRCMSLAILVLLLALSACTAAPAPTAAPQPTEPPAPTATPLPPTATPEPSPTPLTYPSPRDMVHIAYDPQRDQALMVGGFIPVDAVSKDSWLFDPQNAGWSLGIQRPDPCAYPEDSVYDSRAGRILLYCSGFTYEYDPGANAWNDRAPSGKPNANSFPEMAYDSESDKTVFFGGGNFNAGKDGLAETWIYDYTSNTWTNAEPAVHPPAVSGFNMAYDEESDRVILWGGFLWNFVTYSVGEPVENLLWIYDTNANTWESRPVTAGPEMPTYQGAILPIAIAYVPGLDRVFIYFYDNFYTYDYNQDQWEKLDLNSPSKGPGRVGNHGMVYLSSVNKLLVFVGLNMNAGVATNKTWLYDLQTGVWTQVGP